MFFKIARTQFLHPTSALASPLRVGLMQRFFTSCTEISASSKMASVTSAPSQSIPVITALMKLTPLEVGVLELHPVQHRVLQVGALEVGPNSVGLGHDHFDHVRLGEVRAAHQSGGQSLALELRAFKVAEPEVQEFVRKAVRHPEGVPVVSFVAPHRVRVEGSLVSARAEGATEADAMQIAAQAEHTDPLQLPPQLGGGLRPLPSVTPHRRGPPGRLGRPARPRHRRRRRRRRHLSSLSLSLSLVCLSVRLLRSKRAVTAGSSLLAHVRPGEIAAILINFSDATFPSQPGLDRHRQRKPDQLIGDTTMAGQVTRARSARVGGRALGRPARLARRAASSGARRVAGPRDASRIPSGGLPRAGVVLPRSLAEERSDSPISGDSASDYGEEQDVVIVGAGITGLCAALALRDVHGEDVKSFVVTETRDVVGGNVITKEKDGYIWEEGPNSFQPNDFVLKAALDAGCADELVFGDPTASRYVFWEGELRKVPSGPDAVTNNLLSLWGKIRAGLGAVGLLKAPAPDAEETVEQFIRRNLGDEGLLQADRALLLWGVRGRPHQAQHEGSVRQDLGPGEGGWVPGGRRFEPDEGEEGQPSTREGPEAPHSSQGPDRGVVQGGAADPAERHRPDPGRQGEARLDPQGHRPVRRRLQADVLHAGGRQVCEGKVCCLHHPVLRRGAAPQEGDSGCALPSSTPSSYPVGSVVLSYPKSAIRDEMFGPDGRVNAFGQLHPRTQGVTTLGTIYSSSLFPNRCPDGEFLLSSYIGGTLNQGILDQTEDELAAQVDGDLRRMLIKPDAPKPKTVGVRVWQKAIPQFYLGHMEALEAANEAAEEAGYEGMFLSGNYSSGVALGKCIEGAYKVADEVAGTAGSSPPWPPPPPPRATPRRRASSSKTKTKKQTLISKALRVRTLRSEAILPGRRASSSSSPAAAGPS